MKLFISFRLYISLFVFLCCINLSAARANDNIKNINFSELENTGRARIVQIITPQTLQLDDGRIINLGPLYFPDFSVEEPGPFALLAIDVLTDLLLGQEVIIHQTKTDNWGRYTRMGHHIVHLETAKDRVWVQGLLLQLGLALVHTNPRNPELSDLMYETEALAREQSLGIWESTAKVINHEKAGDFINSFQIIEGRIESVALKRNRLYMNFGENWRTDFTVSVTPENRRLFMKEDSDPRDWQGKTIRVRGWIRSYNGPFMEIDHPQAVEIIPATVDTSR